MTRAEYVSRISSLTQELTGLAAEYFSTQRDPYEVAGERFNQAVDAFEQDLSTRTAELEARAAAANAAVDAVTREQEQTQARLVKAIQQGDAEEVQAALEKLDQMEKSDRVDSELKKRLKTRRATRGRGYGNIGRLIFGRNIRFVRVQCEHGHPGDLGIRRRDADPAA